MQRRRAAGGVHRPACGGTARGRRGPEPVAVLYRSHFHALELQLELTRRNIPFSITSGIRFFEQAHIKDVTAYLKLVANPRDELAFKRVALLLPGIGAKGAEKSGGIFQRRWRAYRWRALLRQCPINQGSNEALPSKLVPNPSRQGRVCLEAIRRDHFAIGR